MSGVWKGKRNSNKKQRRRRMTREAFIKKWLGNNNFQYCEEHKELMREDLDSVLNQQTCGFCVEPSEKAKQKEALIKLTQMGDYEITKNDIQELLDEHDNHNKK